MSNNVIGYNGTPEERLERWEAMLLWKQGARELLKNPDTIDIALADKQRYIRSINGYRKAA